MTVTVDAADLRVEANDGALRLGAKTQVIGTVSPSALGDMALRIDVSSAYLARLPATLAAQNINHGFARLPRGIETATLAIDDGQLTDVTFSAK